MALCPNISASKHKASREPNQLLHEREKNMNDQEIENKEELQSETIENQDEKLVSNVFATREIEIEEVAIDGICGVY